MDPSSTPAKRKLMELKELRDEQLIDEEDFQRAKQDIMSQYLGDNERPASSTDDSEKEHGKRAKPKPEQGRGGTARAPSKEAKALYSVLFLGLLVVAVFVLSKGPDPETRGRAAGGRGATRPPPAHAGGGLREGDAAGEKAWMHLAVVRSDEDGDGKVFHWLQTLPSFADYTLYDIHDRSSLNFRNRDAMIMYSYLVHIVQNYDALSPVTVFVHSECCTEANGELFFRRLSQLGPRTGLAFLGPELMEYLPDGSPDKADISWRMARIYVDLFEAEIPPKLSTVGRFMFAVSRGRIHAHSRVFYRRLMLFLDGTKGIGDGEMEASVIERLWHVIFGREGGTLEHTEEGGCEGNGDTAPMPCRLIAGEMKCCVRFHYPDAVGPPDGQP